MMDPEEAYTAASWFVAGVVAANGGGFLTGAGAEAAGREAQAALDAHRNGACLACRREGVVLMDGLFCERCHPALGESVDEIPVAPAVEEP